MPRTRELKPAFFTDEDLAKVSRDHRLLFEALWTLADREGRLEDRPQYIKINFCPYDDDMPPSRVSAMLDDLAVAGFIQRYQVEGKGYVHVKNLKKHQHIHPKEAQSEFPSPPENQGSSSELPGTPGNSRESSNFMPLPSEPSYPSEPSSVGARARSNKPANEPGKPSARSVLDKFGAIRAEVCGGKALFWQAPQTTVEKAAAWLKDMADDGVADIEPAIRLACESVKAGNDTWTDSRLADPAFLFGAFLSRWSSLRECLHGCAPKVAAKPVRESAPASTPIREW